MLEVQTGVVAAGCEGVESEDGRVLILQSC